MSKRYFRPKKKDILGLIETLTIEKPYTGISEIEERIPSKWRLKGCETQNIVNVLVDCYRDGLIQTTSINRDDFLEGREIKGKSFFLTPAGKNELRFWLVRHWQLVTGILVSSATITTAIYSALEYYSNN